MTVGWKRLAFAIVAALALLVGFARSAPAASRGGPEQTIVVGGVTRSYVLFQPTGALHKPVPLLIALQGAFSSGSNMESLTGFDTIAQSGGFVVAYPEPEAGIWHLGCCDAVRGSLADNTFVSALIDHLAATASIDPTRVYVVGFSIGGAMAYRLACMLSTKIAGIGSVGGFQYLSTPCQPKRPVSVIEIHGTTDYYGGSCGGQTQTNVGCGFGDPGYEPSVKQLNAQWRRFDGCPATVAHQVKGLLIQDTAARCKQGTGVKLDTITGGSHCWPGGPGQGPCSPFAASAALWAFLSAHHRTAG